VTRFRAPFSWRPGVRPSAEVNSLRTADYFGQPRAPDQVAHRRLAGVDGLRAVAALWVVLFHIRAFSGANLGPGLDILVRSGSTGVSLFLVVSGFCIFLPWAGGHGDGFRTRRFLARRCRRLLPAYYVSVLATLLVVVLSDGHLGLYPASLSTAAGQLAAHVTLTQTFLPQTFYALNGAYWSLGLEWQLYLALPLLIVAIGRFGVTRVMGAVVLVTLLYRVILTLLIAGHVVAADSLVTTAVLPNIILGRWAEFALGMIAAELFAARRIHLWATRLWWTPVLLIPLSFAVVGNEQSHIVYGAVFFVLLCVVLDTDNVVARAASWRPLAALGTMSYSLYLVHQPLIPILAAVFGIDPRSSARRAFVEVILLLPLIIVIAWLLFVTVEQRTLSERRAITATAAATEQRAAVASV
jgi:peptidoglycan/LPS O-acetylase OafA/YrhL